MESILQRLDAHGAALAEMRDSLTELGKIRANQTDTALSLVATVFLPLTFLAGVFGMNFQCVFLARFLCMVNDVPSTLRRSLTSRCYSLRRDGKDGIPGPGIEMLHDKYGAVYFWIIAGLTVAASVLAFHIRGWTQHFNSIEI